MKCLSSLDSIEVASFTGDSSLMAVLTPDDSVNRVEIDIEFRTFADDGVILYSGGGGDDGSNAGNQGQR